MPRPRTFEEVVAAHDPADKVRIERGEFFIDPSVNPFHGEVSLNEDRDVKGDWRTSISTTMAAAMSRSSPVLRRRGGRAIISPRLSLVIYVSNVQQ
jgi:hypothetical protein